MKLINIGFGSMVAASRMLAVLEPDSAPIKRVIDPVCDPDGYRPCHFVLSAAGGYLPQMDADGGAEPCIKESFL